MCSLSSWFYFSHIHTQIPIDCPEWSACQPQVVDDKLSYMACFTHKVMIIKLQINMTVQLSCICSFSDFCTNKIHFWDMCLQKILFCFIIAQTDFWNCHPCLCRCLQWYGFLELQGVDTSRHNQVVTKSHTGCFSPSKPWHPTIGGP